MKYSYIAIDDSPLALENIKNTMEHFPDYVCVGTAGNVNDALLCILDNPAQLVFLDVEIPGNTANDNSFSVIRELRQYLKQLPYFIMVTSYEKYALDAIKNEALDYILKPCDVLEVRKALIKFEQRQREVLATICIKSHGDYRFISLSEIVYLQADNNTTDFYLTSGAKISGYKPLKYYASQLPDYFVRIHNSFMVNTNHVTRIHFGNSKCYLNYTQEVIPFSKSYKNEIEKMKNILIQNDSENIL